METKREWSDPAVVRVSVPRGRTSSFVSGTTHKSMAAIHSNTVSSMDLHGITVIQERLSSDNNIRKSLPN